MAVLAETASIACLLSLAGQCVSGIHELRSLYLCNASTTVQILLKDVESLLRTLHDVQDLLQRVDGQAELNMDTVHTASLRLQVEDCDVNVGAWLSTTRSF